MVSMEEQQAARSERLAEAGTEPLCPFCQSPRVSRSVYIRCNLCGINWEHSEMHLPNYLNLDPRTARRAAALMGKPTEPTALPQADPAAE